ncbi:MAG TPA: PKD-like family lipoprotein [Parasegetibacter sp.]
MTINNIYSRMRFLVAIVLVIVAAISCRKDLSTLDSNKIPGVVIDTTGNSQLSVFQFERLVLQPSVNLQGIPESEVSYEWKVNLLPGDTLYQVISEEKNLDYEVRFKPNTSGKYHHLVYTITDKRNGLKYIMAWPLTVKNNIGEGLVIAESRDGINTDLSHIMSPRVTSGYNDESVKYNVYSSINGSLIPGIVKQLQFTKIFGVDALLGITNNMVFRVNTLDYTYFGKDNDLFYPDSEEYHPQALGEVYQNNLYIAENKLTATYLGASREFGLPFDYSWKVPDFIAANPNSANGYNSYQPAVVISFYDEVNQKFVYQQVLNPSFGDANMYAVAADPGAPFDPGAVLNKVNLAAGINVDRDFVHILKDKNNGNVNIYVLTGGVFNYPDLTPPQAKAVFDVSAAPGIATATKFVILHDQKVIYYATANKIYAIMYSTPTPIIEERFTVPAGETITTLQVYQQIGYPLAESYIPTNNKQLIMSTFGTEGKVYILPMINPGLGNIDQPNIKTYGGFGKISAITPQK